MTDVERYVVLPQGLKPVVLLFCSGMASSRALSKPGYETACRLSSYEALTEGSGAEVPPETLWDI
jgi:hypothetical protein